MKMLLLVVAVAGLGVSCGDIHQHMRAMLTDGGSPRSAAAAIGGQWQLSMQTPQGPVQAGMAVKQDGTKISGTCDTNHTGPLAMAGMVDGKRVSFTVEIQGRKITFSGTVEGNKMSGTTDHEGAGWSATRAPKTI